MLPGFIATLLGGANVVTGLLLLSVGDASGFFNLALGVGLSVWGYQLLRKE